MHSKTITVICDGCDNDWEDGEVNATLAATRTNLRASGWTFKGKDLCPVCSGNPDTRPRKKGRGPVYAVTP